MGFIEKISPKWAYKREAWRQANEIQKRNYDAGMYDRQNRNWFAHNESGEQTDKYFRGTVRARSRDLERNSDLMNANIHPCLSNRRASASAARSNVDRPGASPPRSRG